ncbi:unnamed protein product [Didymodactylos carnosus]|uniref:Uncharacterized protein n=2 Tax=Didymodactylos carnosus TaxID=1234261 RepID=A0A816DYJ6_9BILA|nr:unnamed protein product [Didymodactylos carnosus]CAF4557591.1 unnamed protein product [Didymodactylos carnosus]
MRDTFVYHLLNRALRQLNLNGIFKFRFFITDLYEQLKQEYERYLEDDTYTSYEVDHESLIVYRSQLIDVSMNSVFRGVIVRLTNV